MSPIFENVRRSAFVIVAEVSIREVLQLRPAIPPARRSAGTLLTNM